MENNSMEEQPIDEPIEETKLDLKQPSVKKNLIILCIIVVVVMTGLITAVYKLYKPPVVVEGCNEGDKFSQTSGKPCDGSELKSCQGGELFDRNNGNPCIGSIDTTAVAGEEYKTSIKTYANKNLQFDGECVATPKILNAAKGTKVLLANNSQKILELIAGGTSAILLPYHFAVTALPGTGGFPVTCNGKAAATIQVK